MSLDALPTELVENINHFVRDTAPSVDLSRFSRVSRRYRQIAERQLYEIIPVHRSNQACNTHLFLTLVQRPELALYIKTLYISNHGPTLYASDAQKEQIWQLMATIKERIEQIFGHNLSNEQADGGLKIALELFGRLFLNQHTIPALILCMATNLCRLIACKGMTVEKVLRLRWTNTELRPLSKLERYVVCYCGQKDGPVWDTSVTILPSVVEIRLKDLKARQMDSIELHTPALIPAIPSLRSLIFDQSCLTPSALILMLQSPWLAHVTTLIVQGCIDITVWTEMRAEEVPWNLPALVRALEKYLPRLSKFRWMNSFLPGESILFDTFEYLKHLRFLDVDHELHSDTFLNASLTYPETYYPPSLQTLSIRNVRVESLVSLLTTIRNSIGDPTEARAGLAKALTSFCQRLGLERLTFEVIMEVDYATYAFSAEQIESLRYAADALEPLGTRFLVNRRIAPSGRVLLIAPGYTRPQAQFERMMPEQEEPEQEEPEQEEPEQEEPEQEEPEF